jgi:proteasome beta subunit
MIRFIQSEVSIYSMKRGSPMSVKAAATLVGNVMRNGFYLGLIVGGHDATGGHVFSVDGAGGHIEDDYMSIGSGSTIAMGSLEASYKKNMTKKEAIDVAITALNSSRRRDSASGDGMQISYIGPKGYEEIPQDQIKARCEELGFAYPN